MTGISWTDETWNPVRGCSRVSEGCRHCYAEVQAARIVRMGQGKPTPYDGLVRVTAGGEARWTGEVRLDPKALALPLRWKKPRRIFVNSMSDLFHESLPDEAIDCVLAVMLLSPRHTFQVLTKRAARMRAYMTDPSLYDRVLRAAGEFRDVRPELNQIAIDNPTTCPRSWIWFGVSVEHQAAADERIPELLRTPAAVRFISCEPLLGPVDLRLFEGGPLTPRHRLLHWCIAGCESGRNARPCKVEWLRSIRDQCADVSIPFFLKQAVAVDGDSHPIVAAGEGSKRKAGGVIELPYLDGKQHASFPEVRRG